MYQTLGVRLEQFGQLFGHFQSVNGFSFPLQFLNLLAQTLYAQICQADHIEPFQKLIDLCEIGQIFETGQVVVILFDFVHQNQYDARDCVEKWDSLIGDDIGKERVVGKIFLSDETI